MAGGCIVGGFQIEARQSSQHSSHRTGANFYRHLREKKKTLKKTKISESADVCIALFPSLKNSNGESEEVLAWM